MVIRRCHDRIDLPALPPHRIQSLSTVAAPRGGRADSRARLPTTDVAKMCAIAGHFRRGFSFPLLGAAGAKRCRLCLLCWGRQGFDAATLLVRARLLGDRQAARRYVSRDPGRPRSEEAGRRRACAPQPTGDKTLRLPMHRCRL